MNRFAIEDCSTYKVSVPQGDYQGMRVDRFFVAENDPGNLRLVLHNRPPIPEGWYTRLSEGATIWMSDVPAEMLDHGPFFHALRWQPRAGSVLINGLGLGMCVQAAIRAPNVRRIDVVESDMRVINLVAPHYYALARAHNTRLTTHHADAYTITWPPGTRWDIAWHDIWPEISEDNLDGMTKLMRRYGQRTDWQACWCQQLSRDMRSGAYQRAHEATMQRFYAAMGVTPDMLTQAKGPPTP